MSRADPVFWRFTSGLYYSLRDQQGFSYDFGQSFQDYVGTVLSARILNEQMKVHPEAEFHLGKSRKDTTDWIVQEGDESALFIECKTKRLTWASKSGLADLGALQQDIQKLAGAVVQLYRTIADYRLGLYPSLRTNQNDASTR